MTINVYSIVWNNEFILPHFLKHYEKFADRIFIIDDHSTDRTAEIAKAHPKVEYYEYGFEGLNEAEFNDTFEFFTGNSDADWVMVVDSDEFIEHPDIKNYLANEERWGILQTRGYMMVGKTGKLEDCKAIRMKSWDKPVVFQPGLDEKFPVRFGDGRHSIVSPHAVHLSDLKLLHYKYPSREYYLERNTIGYRRYMDEKLADKMLKRGLDWYDKHS